MFRRLAMIAAGLWAAGPALAHEGAHLHPHGSEGWISVMLALGVIALALGLAAWRK